MRILVTRPREDGAKTAALLAARGHQALLAPLLEPRWLDGPVLDLGGVAAILATSANGIRALIRRTDRRDVPVFAVGPQTAQEARDAGFTTVENADGDVSDLVKLTTELAMPGRGILLYARGEPSKQKLHDQLTGRGYLVRSQTLYEMHAAHRLPQQAAEALRRGELDAALFYSPRSAEAFRDCLAREADLNIRKLIAVCISGATAQALTSLSFRDVRVAERPNQQALLALLD